MTRYSAIDSNLFTQNRKKFIQHLKPNSLALFNANDIMPTNADGMMPFRQNSDLFYLSGIEQEESILLLYPDAPEARYKEMLFLKKTSEQLIVWEGKKYTQEAAQAISGIQSIQWLPEFASIFNKLMVSASNIYLNTNEHLRADNPVQTRDARFLIWCKDAYPLHGYERSAPIMERIRVIKSELEIDLMRQACNITEKGFRTILPLIKPGIMEYEMEAELIREFIRNGSRGFAYLPIIASGANACILHYEANNQRCEAGSTMLIDVGAEYANYAADMTRVIPVSGRFTARQRAVYKAVLRIMQEAENMLAIGNDLLSYQQELGKIIEYELIALGLLNYSTIQTQNSNNPVYKKYFMHGISHHIGLNTHDVGNIYQKFEVGMVLTIEPGIYIPEESLGIRLENNYVIRQQGVENLMANIPLDPEEIEYLMHKA